MVGTQIMPLESDFIYCKMKQLELKPYYDPITVFNLSAEDRAVNNTNVFNDKRLQSSVDNLCTKVLRKKTVIISRLSKNESDRKRHTRILNNEKLDNEQLISYVTNKSVSNLSSQPDSEVLVVSDLVNLDTSASAERVQRNGEELGFLNNNTTPGILAHTSLVIDSKSNQVIGLGDIILFSRKKRAPNPDKKKRGTEADKKLPDEKKESEAWRQGVKNSRDLLMSKGNKHRTYIFDSDAESIANFNYLLSLNACNASTDQRDDFIIKMQYKKRQLNLDYKEDGVEIPTLDGRANKAKAKKKIRLNEYGAGIAFQGKTKLELRAYDFKKNGKRRKRLAREAELNVKYYPIRFIDKENREHKLYIVQAWEDPNNLPESERESAIDSMLITTKTVESLEQALQILKEYEQRWNIEQLFRTVKKQGLKIENCQLGSISALVRIITIAMEVSTQILKLVQARDQEKGYPITSVFNEKHLPILEKLNQQHEGNTIKQQNPYPKDQLSYGTWIIARMGGWNGYIKGRPPGPIIIGRGLEEFYNIIDFWEGLFVSQP